MVAPTNLKPRRLSSRLTRSERGGRGGHLGDAPPAVDDRGSIHEAPEEGREPAPLLRNRERRPCVGLRRPDLESVADDAGIVREALDLRVVPGRDADRIEAVVGAPIGFAFAEDEPPVEPRLRPFEQQHLEDVAVVVRGDPPLVVVVGDVEGVVPDPGAPHRFVHHRSVPDAALRREAKSGPPPAMPRQDARRGWRCAMLAAAPRAETKLDDMHDGNDIPTLRRILRETKTIAMVGLSANWYRPSYFAAKYLLDHGYRVVPVTPRL